MGIGHKLKTLLKERGLTVKEFAQKIDVPPTTLYSFIKRDSQSANSQLLQKIVTALNIPLSELLDIKQYYVTTELLTEHPELKEKISEIILEELRDYEEIDFEKKFTNATIEEFVEMIKFIVISIELDDNFNIICVNMAVSSRKSILLDAFEKLTPMGQKEAIKRVQELTEVPKYRNNKVDKELEKFSNIFE